MITIDVPALAEAVAAHLLEELRAPRWMTKAEAAEHLRVSVRQLERLVADKAVPFHRPEGRLLFDQRELDAWVRDTTNHR